MADLDKMFAEMAQEEPEDTSCDYRIDEDLRVIAIPERGVVLGVEGDKDVNRVRFHMNRYYCGTDLADFAIRVKYRNAEDERNYFTVTEKNVTDSTITFAWVVAADATAYKGTVWFLVSFFIASSDGVISQCFNTTLGQAKSLEGLEVDVALDDPELVDFMTHLKNDLTLHTGELLSRAENAKQAAADSAGRALTSEKNAKDSERKSLASENAAKDSENKSKEHLLATKEYFEQVRTITIGAQGWYATPEDLKAAVPAGENGWWAVVGTTDSIWTWDSDTNAWKDSIQKANLSEYYTKEQITKLLNTLKSPATSTVLGMVKVGGGLTVAADGTVSMTGKNISNILGFTPTKIACGDADLVAGKSPLETGTVYLYYET